jgi:hypothetical protein
VIGERLARVPRRRIAAITQPQFAPDASHAPLTAPRKPAACLCSAHIRIKLARNGTIVIADRMH